MANSWIYCVIKKGVFVLKKLLFIGLSIGMLLIAREPDEHDQVKVGNFAVPGTLQPGPLLGFGQNIITKNEALAVGFFDFIVWKNKNLAEAIPYFLYAPRDDFSIFLGFPTAMRFKDDGHVSSGSEDMALQFEYAFYANHKPTFTNQFTLVTAVYLPTGSDLKNPATGFGSPSFFAGVTATHLATEWYCYTSYGALFTTKHDNSKAGNQFFYQAGFGKNIAYSADKWMLMWMVEMYGWYEQKWKTCGVIDNNSGFNMVVLGPSLWFSTNDIFAQLGIAPVVTQHLFGEQSRNSFFVAFDLGVRFW